MSGSTILGWYIMGIFLLKTVKQMSNWEATNHFNLFERLWLNQSFDFTSPSAFCMNSIHLIFVHERSWKLAFSWQTGVKWVINTLHIQQHDGDKKQTNLWQTVLSVHRVKGHGSSHHETKGAIKECHFVISNTILHTTEC